MTNLQRHMDPAEFVQRGWVDEEGNQNAAFKTPEQGAATSTLIAGSPLVDGVTGRYFEDVNEAEPYDPASPAKGSRPTRSTPSRPSGSGTCRWT
ncbi:hypothetical protein GCM10025867_02870 [Frondihabitans sucicola]|uniref:Uncharacterized protein n=1 Tax=Frondihabitans sucicola TaxID=1268041 RepID=A0ABM8GI46_9MICO|nr:hypothetical protein [Frondihabitans sucicola]BDZ48046.1 hypothetical protein GCM10025867_02870 [Frondihabitans sucicola]